MATDTALAPNRSKWDPTRNLWQWPMFLAGVGVFFAAWQGILAVGAPPPEQALEKSLQSLRSTAEATSPDAAALKSLLATATAQAERIPTRSAQADYIIGSAYLRLAELTGDAAQARETAALAAQHLDRVAAQQLPNPADEEPRLTFRTLKAHAAAGMYSNTVDATLSTTARALMFTPEGEQPGDAPRLAGELFLSHSVPSLREARKAFEKYLKSAPLSTPSTTLAHAKLRLVEVLFSMNEIEEARQWLTQIGPDSPAEVLLPARVHLARMHMKESAWADAARMWDLVISASNVPSALLHQSKYQLAICRQKTAQPDLAAVLFEEAAKIDSPEKFAAIVKLSDLAIEGRDPAARANIGGRLAEALTSLPAGDFANPLLPLNEVQATVEHSLQTLSADGAFETALKLSEAYGKVAASGRDREKKAEVLAAWGTSLRKQNGEFAPKFSTAASEYLALAGVADAPNSLKAERLRRAALYFREASDRTAQMDALAKLVALPEVPEEILGPSLVEYAEVLLASQRPEEALKVWLQAMQSRSVGMSSRYKLARLLIDSGDANRIPLGMELLRQIGGAEKIEPAEHEYRERALVELGQDALKAGRFAEAESTFRKQLGFHSTGAEANLARFLLGVCLLQQSTRTPGASDKADDPKMRKEALDLFRAIVTDIDAQRAKTGQLPDRDLWLRTQSSLRVLQALQQMERLGEVIATAAVVRRDCEGKVEELIALSMMYHAQKQANHPELAMRVLDEMRDVFRVMPDAAFHGPGEYSKEYWDRVWFNPPAEGTAVTPSAAPAAPAPAAPTPLVPISGRAPEPAGMPAMPRLP